MIFDGRVIKNQGWASWSFGTVLEPFWRSFWERFGCQSHHYTLQGAPRPAFGPFREEPKISRFFGGVPTLTFAPKCHHFEEDPAQLLDPFLAPFSSGYPKIP